MLDAGIKVGASPDNCHPVLSRPADRFDALLISHAHEDHLGALGWMLGQGFTGPVFMTPSSFSEMDSVLSNCANDAGSVASRLSDTKIELFASGDELVVGDQKIATGHSGHVVGGVWFSMLSGGKRTVHCGDKFPENKRPPGDFNAGMRSDDPGLLLRVNDMVCASERSQWIVGLLSGPNRSHMAVFCPYRFQVGLWNSLRYHPIRLLLLPGMDESLKNSAFAATTCVFPGAPEITHCEN